jgi:hypothetical protein
MSSGKREVFWRPLNEPGLEHLVLSWSGTGVVADGFIIGIEGRPFRLQYRIEMDTDWKAILVAARVWNPEMRELILKSDGNGNWSDSEGHSFPELAGCIDPDITVTPFTNTIPIRRLQLKTGQSVELMMAYITIPELKLSTAKQRYTCIEQGPNGALYRYEGLDSWFEAELQVDEMGLVIEYQNVWTRVYF